MAPRSQPTETLCRWTERGCRAPDWQRLGAVVLRSWRKLGPRLREFGRLTQQRKKLRLGVVALPTPAGMELDKMQAPLLHEIAPLLGRAGEPCKGLRFEHGKAERRRISLASFPYGNTRAIAEPVKPQFVHAFSQVLGRAFAVAQKQTRPAGGTGRVALIGARGSGGGGADRGSRH